MYMYVMYFLKIKTSVLNKDFLHSPSPKKVNAEFPFWLFWLIEEGKMPRYTLKSVET